MSLSMKVARAAYRGDPGFLGDIGKFLGGAVKTVVGGVSGFATGGPTGALFGALRGSGLIKGGSPVNIRDASAAGWGGQSAMPGTGLVTGFTDTPGSQLCAGVKIGGKCYGGLIGGGTASVGVNPLGPAGAAGTGVIGYGAAPKKSRRMNPLNPRAASRAMRRLASFGRATECIRRDLGKLGRRMSPPRAKSCGGSCRKK